MTMPFSLKLCMVVTMVAMVVDGLDFRTVMGYIKDDPDFSILRGLLEKAHIDLVLEADGAISTLFAPNNEAFAKVPASLLLQIENDPALLQKTLLSHAISNPFISIFMTNDHTEPTLSGLPVRFNVYSNAQNQAITAGGCVITNGDIVLRNGIIHVIDCVILPAEGDILHQILRDDAEFEDLIAALAVTNLLEDLEFEGITVFAPLNSAFQNYFDPNNMPTNLDPVKDLLMNHIVNGTYYPPGLPDGSRLTSLSGHALNIQKSPSGWISVNGHPSDGVIYATNGIIHVMTSVLAPAGN